MMLAIGFICQHEYQSFIVVRDLDTAKKHLAAIVASLSRKEIATVETINEMDIRYTNNNGLVIQYSIHAIEVGSNIDKWK